jgi:hypothetical protein
LYSLLIECLHAIEGSTEVLIVARPPQNFRFFPNTPQRAIACGVFLLRTPARTLVF